MANRGAQRDQCELFSTRPAQNCRSAAFWKLSNNLKLLQVGWVKDAHGLKGELYIQLSAGRADWLSSFKEFWLQKSELQHFKVAAAKPHREGLIVKTDTILDRTQAEKLKGFQFLIPESYLQSEPGETIFLKQIEGFRVIANGKDLGLIQGFSSNGPQDLLKLKLNGSEVLIPLVKEFIDGFDFDSHELRMSLPEGLIEAQLGEK